MSTSKIEEEKIQVKDDFGATQDSNEIEDLKVTIVNEPWLPFLKSRTLTFLKTSTGITTASFLSLLLGYSIANFNQPSSYQTVNSANINYQNLNNTHLREAGLDLSSEVRKFLLRWGVKEQQMSQQLQASMGNAGSDSQKEKLWQEYIQTSGMVLNARKLEFDNQYKQKINAFRNELLERLKAHEKASASFQNPDNPNEWRIIMDEVGELTEQFLEP